MRKINLVNYMVQVRTTEGVTEVPYDVKEALSNIIFHPELKLGGREIILRGKLAEKIDKAGKEIIFEEADYNKIKQAFETVKGFGKNELELCRRVLEAELIETEQLKVEEKKKK